MDNYYYDQNNNELVYDNNLIQQNNIQTKERKEIKLCDDNYNTTIYKAKNIIISWGTSS